MMKNVQEERGKISEISPPGGIDTGELLPYNKDVASQTL